MPKLVCGCIAFHKPIPASTRQSRVVCFYGSGQSAVNLRLLAFPCDVERYFGIRTLVLPHFNLSQNCPSLQIVLKVYCRIAGPRIAWIGTVVRFSCRCCFGASCKNAAISELRNRPQWPQVRPRCRCWYLQIRCVCVQSWLCDGIRI
jgi:hypothetical protein